MNGVDMSKFVIPKSDQLNADDLIAGPRTITITKVSGTNNADQPVSVYFEGDNNKPYKPGKSMRRVMVAAWGIDASLYVGRRMTLYNDPAVMFGGMQVGGVRISHMSDIERELTMLLTTTKSKRSPFTVKVLREDAPRISNKERMFASARAAAGKGTEALAAFRKGLQPVAAEALAPILDELIQTASAVAGDPPHDPKTGEVGGQGGVDHDDVRI